MGEQVEARTVRQHEIEYERIECTGGEGCAAIGAIRDDIEGGPEHAKAGPEAVRQDWIVFDDKDAHAPEPLTSSRVASEA
jgi:hypothetical protein